MKLEINGEIVDIRDDQNDGDFEQTYSTEERKIGTWINGKPLYRTTFESKITAILSWASLNKVIQNLDQVVAIYGIIVYTNHMIFQIPGGVTSLGYNILDMPGVCYFCSDSTAAGATTYISIEYTKTTDQATIETSSVSSSNLDSTENEDESTFEPADFIEMNIDREE